MKKLIFIIAIICFFNMINAQQYSAPFEMDYTDQLVSGLLTESGDQYSTVDTTAGANVSLVLYQDTLTIKAGDYSVSDGIDYYEKQINDVYFKIIVELKAATSGTAKVYTKIQAKNLNKDDWADISGWSACASAIGTTYVEKTLEGWASLSDDFSNVPFEIRVLIKSDTANEGVGRVKNWSYIRVIFWNY